MDVRQFAFLARQPSAALKNRTSFLGLPKRGLALILVNAMFWQPLLAQADGIVVNAPGTTLAQAGNGVPIVNIAAPNAGLSHNQFHDYNVGAQGLILNNATDRTQSTQLGGIIVGNPNFTGQAASTILNEVNGGSPSQLRGYTEVAGQAAHVIVANPYGVSCNGCGFINTPQVTLTTGQAVIENGKVSRYQVDQGSVSVDGDGLNASNVGQFEIITRAAHINAQIQAQKLTVVAGRNDVDASTLNAAARAADGSAAPALAIDSSALGGMYAGTIRLVGTEAGVGVKLAGNMVAGGDIRIDANGHLNLGQTSAGNALNVTAQSLETQGAVYAGTDLAIKAQGDLSNTNNLAARDSITLDSGARLSNSGIIEAGVNADNSRNANGDVRLTAQTLDNTGNTIIASRDLTVNAAALVNQHGTLSAGRQAQVSADQVDNTNQGRIISAGSLGLTASQLLNNTGGLLSGTGNLNGTVGQLLNNAGELSSVGQVSLQVASLDNVAGLVSAGQALSLNASGALNNQGGRIAAGQAVQLTAGALDNSQKGALTSQGTLDLASGLVNNSAGGQISSTQGLHANLGSLDQHDGGRFYSTADMSLNLNSGLLDNRNGLLNASGQLTLKGLNTVNNHQGEISSAHGFSLAANSLDNGAGKLLSDQALTVQIAQVLNNGAGVISANGLQVAVGSLDNTAGRVASQSDVSLDLNRGQLTNLGGVINAPGQLLLSHLNGVDNRNGEISSTTSFSLLADNLDNSNGKLLSAQALTVHIAQALENAKGLVSAQALEVHGASLGNVGGTLSATGGLAVQVDGGLDNRNGQILAHTASVTVGALDNRQGQVQGDANLSLVGAGAIDNRQGTLATGQAFDLSAASLDNTNGSLTSNGQLTAQIAGQLLNQTGLFAATGDLQLSAASLDNGSLGRIIGKANSRLAVGQLDNRGGEVSSVNDLSVTGTGVDNSQGGHLLAGGALQLTLDRLDNQLKGILSGQHTVSINAGSLDNSGQGSVYAKDDLSLLLRNQFNNGQGVVRSDSRFSAQMGNLINDGGRISSAGPWALTSQSAVSNKGGELLSAAGLMLTSASLDNSVAGHLIGDGAVRVVTGALNNQGGQLTSADRLDLSAAQVDNSGAGRIASTQALNASVTGLDQHAGGQLYSTASLTLDLNHGLLNNAGGLIHAPGALLLNHLDNVDNSGGEISSAQAFTFAAQNLDNSAGKLISDQALTLTVAQLLTNLNGEISAAGLKAQAGTLDNTHGLLSSSTDLGLTVAGNLVNDNGEVSSAGASVVNAATLSNKRGQMLGDNSLDLNVSGALGNNGGTLGAGQRLQVKSASLDNSQSGSLVSDGSLSATVDGLLDNHARGSVQAKGAVDIQSASLDNRTGAIRTNGNLNLHTGQVDNRQGVINSKQALGFVGQSLNNSNGLTSATGPVQLAFDTVSNDKGRIASQGDLDATLGALTQQGGELVAQGNLTLNANTLDNRNGGLVAATKALKLSIDSVDNRVGEISSQQSVSLSGQYLDNSGGKLLAATALELAVAQVINQAKGLVFAQDAHLVGTRLDNTQGSVAAQHSLAIQLAPAMLPGASLINAGGTLSSEGGLTLLGQRLDNTGGKVSSAGLLSVTSAGDLLNLGGTFDSAQGLALSSASLDNSQQGLIKSDGASSITTGQFNNATGGQLTSTGKLDLTAAQVNNGGRIASADVLSANVTGLTQQNGQLFSNTQLNLNLNGGDLSNSGLINAPILLLSNLGNLSNQGGEISSQNAFSLAARSLDNSNGKLISNQALTLTADQQLGNVNGHISAVGFTARSTQLDNTDGIISSHDGVDISARDLLTNLRGSLVGDGSLLLTTASLDNRAGQVAGKADTTLNAGVINNQKGQVISTDTLHLRGASLDNRTGLVGATNALKLDVGSVDNRAGELNGSADVSVNGQQLNNSDGGKLFAANALSLVVDQLLNRTLGQLNGQRVTLTGSTLDNSGGKVFSQQPLVLNLTGDVNNTQGLLSSESQLTLNAANLINAQGSVSSAQDLTLGLSGQVNNLGGELVTDGALNLHSAGLGNGQGNISGKGALALVTGDLTNQSGSISSGDTLSLTAGQLSNGGSIGSHNALTASVTGLDQQGGKLFSNGALTLDVNNGLLSNTDGLINSAGLLQLNHLTDVTNHNGEISSGQAFTLVAQNLDNSNGKLLSNQWLTLRVNQTLSNIKGLIGAASLDAHAASVDNSNGTLNSRGDLQLTSDGLLNNTGLGLIHSQGNLNLTAGSLNTGSGGEVSALGTLDLSTSALTSANGRVTGEQRVTLDLNNGDLDNHGGLILGKGPLAINHLRDLNNQGGEVSSQQNLVLAARALDNSAGKLISSQALTLGAANLINANGLVSGWQSLGFAGGSLDNRNNGTFSSRSGAMAVNLTGALLNSGAGALVSQGRLDISAASLDNSGGGILSSAAGQGLTVSGLLNNSGGGLIDSGATLDVQAATLSNDAGALNAQQALAVNANDLGNAAGTLASNGAMTLNLLGNLTNTNGKLASAGPLLLQRAAQVNNQGGQIVSQNLLSLFAGAIDNSQHGTLAGTGSVAINASGAVQNNADGLIYSQGADVQLQAAGLANSRGVVQGQNGLTLNISGDVDNQSGKLIAQTGDLTLNANNLDNRGGTFASLNGALQAQIVGVLRNGYDLNNNRQGGTVQGQRLNLQAAMFDNYGGRVSAQGGDALVTTGNFDNRNGGLYATGLVSVSGNDFDNSGDNDGQIAGQQIDLSLRGALNNRLGVVESQSTLKVSAASLDNGNGRLRALGNAGTTEFAIGGLLDNTNGVLETANSNLILGAGSLQNVGGSVLHVGNGNFTIAPSNLNSVGGSLVTRGGLTIAQDTWTNSSVIQAGRLTVNVNTLNQTADGQLLASSALTGTGENWSTNGLIASDGSLDLHLGGTLNGAGRITSQGDLSLSAAQLNLSNTASVAGGGLTSANITGTLNNAGRLTSANDLIINAGAINNTATLGSAQKLTATSGALLNDHGLIFSGGDMSLRVDTLTNSYADVYSLGNLSIDRDGQGGLATQILNSSSSLQSDGNMSLAASTIQNVRAVLTTSAGGIYTASITEFPCIEGPNYAGDCSGKQNHLWQIDQREKLEVTASSAASSITAGQNLSIAGGDVVNASSTIGAGGNLGVVANNLTNSGVETGETDTWRLFVSERTRHPEMWYDAAAAFNNRYSVGGAAYNASDLSGLAGAMAGFIGITEAERTVLRRVTQISAGDQTYAGVIQAGGAVNVKAQANIDNSVVRPGFTYVGAGAKTGTGAAGASGAGAFSTRITVNGQLPPDLAQRQINPLTLPGFSLPTGQNGLFRLSGQGSSAPAQGNNAPGWSVSGASLQLDQHQITTPTHQGRVIQINAPTQDAAGSLQLNLATRQASGIGASSSGVGTIGDGGGASIQTPGRSSAADASQVVAIGTQNAGGGAASSAVVASHPNLDLPAQATDHGSTVVVNAPSIPGVTPVAPAATTGDKPSPVASQSIARVQGLPGTQPVSQPQKYLIETNPVLTDLKQFMSSDYLLSGLGYNPDDSAKRLGDGLYEQRLVEQAVVARTGQRFIDGQNTDSGMLKYLMDNAIRSKQQLGLSVGVSLTSAQVAALTHDIVWLEEEQVNGENVLVPVVYLAQANNRLAPDGALIAGNDVNLIAGQNLDNVGTLRASNNLSAQAGNDLTNSGLIQAGNRLNLLAGNTIVNTAGGIIAGRDVNLTVTQGDILNERSVTSHDSSSGYRTEHTDSVDSAARIEAVNNLSLQAGRDVNSVGGVMSSGADTTLKAGRDVNLISAEGTNSNTVSGLFKNSSVTQYGSRVDAGGDLKVQAGRDISAVASEIDAKRDVTMSAVGDLSLSSAADESHASFTSKKVKSKEDHVSQVSTTVKAGGDVALSAGQDLALTASRVTAGDEAYLYAGKDLNLAAAEDSDYSYYSKTKKGSWGKKSSKMSESENDVAVSSSVDAGKKVSLSAGQDFNAEGAKVSSGDALQVSAGHDVNLDTADNYTSQANASSKKGLFSSKSSSSSSSQSTVTSTELQGNSITVQADNDVTMNAAALKAQQAVKLSAGRDIEIGTAEQQQTASQSSQSSKFGFNIVAAPSLTQKAQLGQQSGSQSIGTSISAGSLDIQSGRDTAVRGSTLVTDNGLRIDAGRNLDVVSAEDQSASSSKSSSKKAGEIGSWWQDAMGVAQLKDADKNASTRQAGSQVASLGGDVSLTAGEHYNQVASQVIAPKGDISITAKDVDIQAGFDVLNANHTASASRTAIGGSIDIPLLDAARGVQGAVESAGKTSDPRMQGLAAANAAMSGKKTYDAAQDVLKNGVGFKVSVSLSNSESHSDSSQSGQNVVSSSLAARGDINVTATGAGKDSTLNVVGSRIDAGHDVNLKADGDINLLSAQNTAVQKSTNGNSGGSVGIGLTVGGTQNGLSLDLAANKGMGMSDGHDVTQTNTSIKAGNKASLDSGNDTNLKGAVVTAKQVQADVGGDLNLSSLQDTSKFSSKQVDASVGVSICIPPFCYGVSGTASFNQQKMNSDYASVSEQTGIKAGDGGFQVDVKGNTDLNGAIIASSDQAVKDGKNTLSTGTLTSSDVKNKASYDASSIGLSGGMGEHIGRAADGSQKAGAPGTPVPNNGKVSANAPIALLASGDASSVTQSGISGATVKINDDAKQQALTGQTAAETVAAINTDVSSDRDGSNKLKPIFNPQEIQAGFDITAKFVQNVGVYLEDRASEADAKLKQADKEHADAKDETLSYEDRDAHLKKAQLLEQQAKDISNNWGAGGTYRQIATALVAGASGNVTGGSSQFAQNMFVNYVQQQGADYIGKLVINGLKEGSPEHAGLHAILGCAGAAASQQSCSAGALGGSASSVLAGLFNETDPNETKEEREAKRNIIASVVTGIAAMSNPNGAATATNAAIANVDNNWLATQQIVQMTKELAEAKSTPEVVAVFGKWLAISGNQDLITGTALFNSFKDSMAGSGVDVLNSAVGVLRDPVATVDAMREFAESADGKKLLGAAADTFKSQISQIREALVVGGDENAENLGKQLGEAVALYAQLIATGGAGGAAKESWLLSKAGVEVTSSGIKEIAAGVKATGGIEAKLAKLEKIGPDPDVPSVAPVESPNHVLVDSAKYVKSSTIEANTTVQLTESVRLKDDSVIPKGSIVTVSDDAMKVVYPDGTSELVSYSKVTTKPLELPGAKDVVPNPGKTAVYSSTAEDGTVQYVGITDNLEARSAAHLSQKGIEIDAIPGLQNISRSDARAVEQVLIEYNGLGKDGGSLINKINSISTANPIYAESLARGAALLKAVGYPGFK
ncbi:hemagglutinin repeat-containing protein [Pseudomonas veronii]|uniref:hemagglutinin repeat-containing protein n=1 Tax=Pseudomonas veronii TaxID=76761 RepID=UPI0021C2301D|nr:hemagglutinin repeat-containing protein [Pseudomonas veronii]MCT9823503.1 hemagglutinin repeat-containing protein [Pseudomonas veronii]